MPVYEAKIGDATYELSSDRELTPEEIDAELASIGVIQGQSQTDQGRISTFASGVARGALSPVPGIIGGVGALTGIDALTETAESIEQGINETFPMNPAYEQEFWTGKAPQAIGQGISMLAMGGVGGLAGKGVAAARGLQGAQAAAAGVRAASGTMIGAGTAMGAREGQQEGEQYGLTGANLYARILAGAAIEPLTEKLPFGMLAETAAMRKIFGGALDAKPVSAAGIIATESAEEGSAQLLGDTATNIGATIEGTQGIGLGEMAGRAGESGALGAVAGVPFAAANLAAGRMKPEEPLTFGGSHARQEGDLAVEESGIVVAVIPKGSPLTPDQVKAMSPKQYADAAESLQIKIPRPASVVSAELTALAASGQPVPVDPQAIRPQDAGAVTAATQTNPETLAAVVAMTTKTTPVAAPQTPPAQQQAPTPVTPPEVVAGVDELTDAEAQAIDAELGINPDLGTGEFSERDAMRIIGQEQPATPAPNEQNQTPPLPQEQSSGQNVPQPRELPVLPEQQAAPQQEAAGELPDAIERQISENTIPSVEDTDALREHVKALNEKIVDDASYGQYAKARDALANAEFVQKYGARRMRLSERDAALKPLNDLNEGIDVDAAWRKGEKISNNSKVGGIFKPTGGTTNVLFRGVSLEDWNRIQEQGFIDTDGRGAISPKEEQINLADNTPTAFDYIPSGSSGVVLAIDPKGLDIFMIGADDYPRAKNRIPIGNVVAVSPVFSKGQSNEPLMPLKKGKVLPESAETTPTQKGAEASQLPESAGTTNVGSKQSSTQVSAEPTAALPTASLPATGQPTPGSVGVAATKPVSYEQIQGRINELLRAPTASTKKPAVSFKTQTEEKAFALGFENATKRQGEPLPKMMSNRSAKDQRWDDAWAKGWSSGQVFVRSLPEVEAAPPAAQAATAPQEEVAIDRFERSISKSAAQDIATIREYEATRPNDGTLTLSESVLTPDAAKRLDDYDLRMYLESGVETIVVLESNPSTTPLEKAQEAYARLSLTSAMAEAKERGMDVRSIMEREYAKRAPQRPTSQSPALQNAEQRATATAQETGNSPEVELRAIIESPQYTQEWLQEQVEEARLEGVQAGDTVVAQDEAGETIIGTVIEASEAGNVTPETDAEASVDQSLSDTEKSDVAIAYQKPDWNSAKDQFYKDFAEFLSGTYKAAGRLLEIMRDLAVRIGRAGASMIAAVSFSASTSQVTETIPLREIVAVSQQQPALMPTQARGSMIAAQSPISQPSVLSDLRGVPAFASQSNIPTPTVSDQLNISGGVIESSVDLPNVRARANFRNTQASKEVVESANWIVKSGNNEGFPFVIADKQNGVLFAFDQNGNLAFDTPALYGADLGDVTDLSKPFESEESKVTPTGRFFGDIATDPEYGTTLDFLEGNGWMAAIHKVYLGTPDEMRPQRLSSSTPEDNRISYGCINLPAKEMRKLANLAKPSAGAYVYVLPETDQGREIFNEALGGKFASRQSRRRRTKVRTTSGDVTVPTAGLVRQAPQSLSRKPGLAQALMESDGAALQLGISQQDVERGINALRRQIPGASNIWSGTRQAFLDTFGNDPAVQDMVQQLEEGVMTEGFFSPRLMRGFILLDGAVIYEGDAARAELNGTTPAVETAKRLIRHEVGGHGGWETLTQKQKQDFLEIARDVIPVSEINQMIEDGYPFQDWQTDEFVYMEAAMEWVAQRIGRMDKLPETGPMARFVDWLKGVWRWLTGRKGDPDLDAIKNLWRQIRMNQAAMATGRAWYSLPGQRIVTVGDVRASRQQYPKFDVTSASDAVERMLSFKRPYQMEVLTKIYNKYKPKGTADALRAYEENWGNGDEEFDQSGRFETPLDASMFDAITYALETDKTSIARIEEIAGFDIATSQPFEIRASRTQSPQAARHAALEAKHNAGTITAEETAEAEAIVAEAARGAGKMFGKWFHGSPSGERFEVFDPTKGRSFGRWNSIGSWFTLDRKAAEGWAENYQVNPEGGLISDVGNVYDSYLFLKNPLSIDGYDALLDLWNETTGVDTAQATPADVETFKSALREQGYDGIVVSNVEGDSPQGADPSQTYAIALAPNQIKSAAPFTGVPLDQRFDSTSNDIRYSRVRSNAEIASAIRQQATLPNDPQTASEGKVIRDDVAAQFEPSVRQSIQQAPPHELFSKNMGVDKGAAILDTLMQPERDPSKMAEMTPAEIEQRGGDVELNLVAHEEAVRRALVLGDAVSSSALARYGISLPTGYRKFGELSAPVSPSLIRAVEFLTNQSLTEEAGIGMATTIYPYLAYRLMNELANAETNARSNVERVALSQAMSRIYQATSGINSLVAQRNGATGIAQRYFGVTAGGVMALVENTNKELQGRIDASVPVDDLVAEINRLKAEIERLTAEESGDQINTDTDVEVAEADMLKQEGIAESIIEEIANRLGDAPVTNDVERKEREQTIRDLHLRNVRQGMTKQDFIREAATFEVFEGLASRLWSVGNMEREARATIKAAIKDIRLNEIAQERASQLIYKADPTIRDSAESASKDTINKAFRDQIKTPVEFDAFRARMRNLRVSEKNIELLFRAAESEQMDLAAGELRKTRENLLQKESPHLAAIIRRIKDRIAPGISWRDLMVVDAQDGQERIREIYRRVRKHEALRDLTYQESKQLTNALNRHFIKVKEKVLRKELQRVGATGTPIDPRVANLFEQIRQGKLTAAQAETEIQTIVQPSRWRTLRKELPNFLQDLAYGRVTIDQFAEKLGRGRKASDRAMQHVIDSTPKLIQAMNLGAFNAQAFRDAVSEQFGLKVITSEQAREIQQMVIDAQKLQPGLPRDRAVSAIIDRIADYTSMSGAEIFNSFWVSSVLSGGRTQFDTWMNQLNAMRRVLQLAAWTSAKRVNQGGVSIGWNAITRYFEVLPGMFQNALWYLWSGDSSLLLSEARETDRFLNNGQFSQSMDTKKAERLLSGAVSALGRGDIKQGIMAFPAFFIVGVRRLMQAADYFSAAATLEASIPLAIALNPELAGDTRIPSRKDYANFRLRAREILTGGREPKSVKEKVEERILSQQLLMQSIDSLALRDEIMELGVEASYQNDPTGIGGIFYNSVLAVHQKIVASAEALRERGQAVQESNSPEMLKKADMAARNLMYALAVGARALTGLQFARFAGNKTNELLGMTPIIGLARLAEKDKTRSQRAMMIMDNVVGTAIAVGGIIYAMGLLEDDDDDERRGWRIEGGWDGLTADETRQLRAAGKQPYSIGYLDRQDGTWKNYSYLQWATSGAFATVGNLRDRKRYRPELWSEDNFVGATIAAAAGNGQALMNMSMLQNLNDIFGGNNAFTARDPVQGMAAWLNRFASSYAGGFIPRAFKDADYMMDPRHTKANGGIELWLQHVPFYRRGIGEPYLDSLGYQVELRREPWSRAFVETQGTAAHNALSSLVGNGIFISSLNMDNRVVRRGEDVRPMTDAEQKRMMDFYFPALRRYLVTEGPRLERMPMDAAKDKISRDIQNLKSDAQDRAVR